MLANPNLDYTRILTFFSPSPFTALKCSHLNSITLFKELIRYEADYSPQITSNMVCVDVLSEEIKDDVI